MEQFDGVFVHEIIDSMTNLKETDLPCPACMSGNLVEPVTTSSGLGYVPVKCSACNFTGRRVNLVVVPDQNHGESWSGLLVSA